ncbi:DUF5819 family protein [Aeromicrobium marinum]|nr:DUF5819 family protein [Aeromicrobium marinum]
MPETATPPRAWQRWLMLVLGGAVVVHSAVVGLWLSPDNPIRESVGGRTLAAYVNPYFQQSPRALDPGAQFADESLELRARIRGESGELEETAWVDLTAEELERHGTVGPRILRAPRSLATNLNAAVREIPEELQPLLAEDYGEIDLVELEGLLFEGGATSDETRRYFASHFMATRYGTLYATARWGGIVEQIQVRIGLRRVPDYDERGDTELTDLEFESIDLGWRQAVPAGEGAQRAFNDYVERETA